MAKKHTYLVVETIGRMGRIMLESGAEVYRVEHTLYRLCASYGIPHPQCSVRPSELTISFIYEEKPQTYMLRSKKQRLNLHKVECINALSYKVTNTPLPVSSLKKEVDLIENSKPFGALATGLAAGIGTGAYALNAGGTFIDFVCGFTIGFLLRLLVLLLSNYGFKDIFTRFFAGSIAAFLSALLVLANIGSQWDLITVSALTLLFPGLLFTNALRDIGTGDFVSALTHAVEAFSIAAALAGGAALVHGLFIKFGVFLA